MTQELQRRGLKVNHKRVHHVVQDFHLALKRTARKPKLNPLLQIPLLTGDQADLRASLLKRGDPKPFELLYADVTLLPYRGGKAQFVPILGQPRKQLCSPRDPDGGGPWPGPVLFSGAGPGGVGGGQGRHRGKDWEASPGLGAPRPSAALAAMFWGSLPEPRLGGDAALRDGPRLSYSLMGAKGVARSARFLRWWRAFLPGSRGGRTSFWRPRALES